MALPAPIITPPIGGYEYGPIAAAPLITPPMVDEGEIDVSIPPIEPAMPDDFEIVPGPAVVEPAPVADDEPAPLLDVLGAQPAPVEGADVDIAAGYDQLQNLSEARVGAEREAADAADTYRQAAGAYQAATTPAQQQEAAAMAEQAQQRIQGARVVAQAAGLAQEQEQAAQTAEIESALHRERTSRMTEAAGVLDARAAETERRVADAQAERERAQERRAARETEYAALLDRGPQDVGATWTAAIGMIGEMWSAFAQKRTPNLGTWLERGLAQAKEAHAGDLDAVRARIGIEDQAIEDVAVEVAQRKADDLAFEGVYLAKLDRDLALLSAQYAQTPQGMAADQARQAVAAQQQQRAAEAQAAQEKAERERAKFALEQRKLTAETMLAERKARGGDGKAAGKTFGDRTDVSPNALIDPVSGIVLGESRFQDRGKVREDQDTVNKFSTALEDIELYVNLLEKVGRTYQGFGASNIRADDVKRLEAMHGDLFMKTRSALTGAAASAAEEKIILGIIPGPKSYADLGSWNPANVMRLYRDRMSGEYERFATSRLTTGATLIKDAKGNVLPSSPTYVYRASKGELPKETPSGKIFEELAKDYPEDPITPYRETLIHQLVAKGQSREAAEATADRRARLADPYRKVVDRIARESAGLKGPEREDAIDTLERSRDALRSQGLAKRADYLDEVIKKLQRGEAPEGRTDFED